MATNVKPHDLNYDKYSEEKYDKDIINSIPGHEELHRKIDEIIDKYFKNKEIQVLELGVGTGLSALRILNKIGCKKYFAIDFSEKMINHARNKLSKFDVEFIKGDFSKIKLPNNNDIVVSVIAIHHQKTNNDKKELFKRIFDSLSNKGAFIFGDLVTYRDKNLAAINNTKHFHYLVEKSTDKNTLQEWEYHQKYQNNLAPLEDQVEWLKEIGFKDVNVIFQKFNTVLIYARK
jgi:tRNA (cmo5U34)-methyltransferase